MSKSKAVKPAPASMLEFYIAEQISPVHQDIRDLAAHFDRRGSLYRCLGLLPSAFRDATVLEVGPGSGHNSLYIASRQPRRYDLVEGNPVAGREIAELYRGLAVPHTKPAVTITRFEDFQTSQRYDICISEGWLGSSEHERKLVGKLARFVAEDGVLVVTTISPIGLIANMLRRALGIRLTGHGADTATRTRILVQAFGGHLTTMKHMTRPHVDWVQDNLVSPAYYGICLTPEMVLAEIGAQFEYYSSSPRIASDWRWYKMLQGPDKAFNRQFLDEYYGVCHSFIDYQSVWPARSPERNRELEAIAWSLLAATRDFEAGAPEGQASIAAVLKRLQRHAQEIAPSLTLAFEEFAELFGRRKVSVADVDAMTHFRSVFGRELIYLSFHRAAG